ncbi:MAG: NADH-quinone oxidoreductase subunit C [Bacteroidales bacterium]|nr:NADH-quinone oxidoreductase subunit C [Bacteroidales bacterium]
MSREEIINRFRKKFEPEILDVTEKSPKRMIFTVRPEAILAIADYLYNSGGFRFIIATALHTRKGFEIHYHFSRDEIGLILNIHVVIDMDDPKIESLSNLFNASNWIEREMHELYGINFVNHPNQEKLISEGNWAEGVYPYRKEFK